jgi:hypothetical protein
MPADALGSDGSAVRGHTDIHWCCEVHRQHWVDLRTTPVVDLPARETGCRHESCEVDRYGYRLCGHCGVPLQWWAGWVNPGVFGDLAATWRWASSVAAELDATGVAADSRR